MGQAPSSLPSRRFNDNDNDESEEHQQEPPLHSTPTPRRRANDYLFRGSPSSLLGMAAEFHDPSAADSLRDARSRMIRREGTVAEEGPDDDSTNYSVAPVDINNIADFVPSASPHHEWMGRSIETLVLGHMMSPTPMLSTAEDDMDDTDGSHDTADNFWMRRSSLSTRGSLDGSSLDFLNRGSSLDFGVRRPHGGTLANYYNRGNRRHSSRQRQRRTSTSSSISSSSHQSPANSTPGPNIVLSLLAREATGRSPSAFHAPSKRLGKMGGKTLHQRLDHPAGGIVTEIKDLQSAISRGDWTETSNLVSRLTPRLMGDPMRTTPAAAIDDPTLPSFASPYLAGGGRLGLERDAFVLGGGVQVFLSIFRETAFVGHELRNDTRALNTSVVSNKLASCWNEVLASLRELVYALPVLVENGTILDGGKFVPFLFTLLSHDTCFDSAATLIEEILSLLSHSPPAPTPPDEAPIDGEYRSSTFVVPVSTFFLGNVPGLYSLWRGFSCRQLAHFCRILALLVFEPEDRQLLESPSVLKSLELLQLRRDRAARAGRDATVDMNQSMLLGDKIMMQRLLHLLKIMNYAPTLRRSTAYHVMAHFPFISETLVMLGLSEMDNWSDVSRLDTLAKELLRNDGETRNLSELGSVADMLESLAGSLQANSLEPATQLGHIIHVINAAQQAGVVVGRRGRRQRDGDNGSSIHVSSVPLESASLDSLTSAAMTLTDQLSMRRSVSSNITPDDNNLLLSMEVQDGQNTASSQSQHPYATTGRMRISAPEDAANEMQFNALLLAPYQVEVLFVLCTLLGGRRKIDAQRFLNDHDLIPTMDDMFHRLSFGSSPPRRASRTSVGSGDAPSSATSEVSGDQQEEAGGIHGPGCECTPESALSVQYLRLLHNFCDRDCDNYPGRRLLLSEQEREYVFSDRVWKDAERPENLQPGLFSKVIGAFSRESDDSPYRFWLASCAESYLRGSSPHEQLFAAKSGLLGHLVRDIVSDRLHCAGSLQTSFDLLGEVCKGNSEVLDLLVSRLDEENFRKLMSAAAANLVDSNVFLRSLLLTVERISAARLFKSVESPKATDPWKNHEYGPWTGRSGSDTRFYLTHSWWDASIVPLEGRPRKPTKYEASNEESYDDARSSDWFPPGCSVNGRTILGEGIPSQQLSPIDSGVGYNGWQFSPPAMRRSLEEDPLAWALGDAAFLPNTIERLAWFLITNQSRLLRDLLCVVDLRNINHENICCLNTAVVVSVFASRRDQLSGVLRELKRLSTEEQEAATRGREAGRELETAELVDYMSQLKMEDDNRKSPPGRHLRQLSSVLGDRTDILRNFRELLWFWSEYYTHRGRDRLSLEFSSHMRFEEWFKVVAILTEDDGSSTALVRSPSKMPRSPYQRAARIVDNPRRSG